MKTSWQLMRAFGWLLVGSAIAMPMIARSQTAPVPTTPPSTRPAPAPGIAEVSEVPIIRLWPGDAPLTHGQTTFDIPALTPYPALPTRATGAVMLICPGGGYGTLSPRESKPIADWANSIGMDAYVLRYRLGTHGYRYPTQLLDVQRAIRLIRANAADWKIDPHRLAIIGFSAGGHLAATAATHFDAANPANPDPIDRQSDRPDRALLIYPVITMTPQGHGGSRRNLLGDNPDAALVDLLSNEKHVTRDTPPCFLAHGADDRVVPVQNSLMFAAACATAGVPFELHIFQHGPHGFALGTPDPALRAWPAMAAQFLARDHFLDATSAARP